MPDPIEDVWIAGQARNDSYLIRTESFWVVGRVRKDSFP